MKASILTLPKEVRGLIYDLLTPFDKLNLRESLKLFRKEIKPIDNIIKKDVVIDAATRGYLSVLKYRSQRRFVWCQKIAGLLDYMNSREEKIKDVLTVSKQLGLTSSVVVLTYLRQSQYNLDLDVICLGACMSGKLDVVKWCWKEGASPGTGHILTAKAHKHRNIVSWLSKPV